MITSQILNNKDVLSLENVRKLNFLNIAVVTDFVKEKFASSDRELYLNLTGVDFIDSFSFERLVAVNNYARSKKKVFKLFNISEELEELFELTGSSKHLNITDLAEIKGNKGFDYQLF